MLTGFFVACGGTGDNFSDGGEGGGGFGSSGVDGSSGGDDVISTPDASFDTSSKDSPIGTCSATCTSNAECASACGTGSTYCCDVPTGACYPTSLATCPSGVVDSGGADTAPY